MCKYEQSYFSKAMHVRKPELGLGVFVSEEYKADMLSFFNVRHLSNVENNIWGDLVSSPAGKPTTKRVKGGKKEGGALDMARVQSLVISGVLFKD